MYNIEEELKKLAQEEIVKAIKNELDSSMIFKYVEGLEEENKRLKEKEKHYNEVINNMADTLAKMPYTHSINQVTRSKEEWIKYFTNMEDITNE